MRVLIIDDDEAMIGIWSTVLKNGGIDVLTAGSGKLGLELATKNIPDFILCDQIITDMKGNDVLKQLKANPATAKIPVALVSNYSEPEMMHDAIENGAIDYILKYQIDPSDLANKIKTLLHGTKPINPATPGQPIQQPVAPAADPAPIVQPQIVQPAAPTIQQPQIIDPSAPVAAPAPAAAQPVIVDPTAPTPQAAIPQPQIIDPTKPTQ